MLCLFVYLRQAGHRKVTLTEIAPGADLQRDILDKMEFRPEISPELAVMDERLFRPERMGLSFGQ